MDNDKPNIFIEYGIPMTTSLEVARIFGKKHHHVMRDIRELEIPDHFRRSNFGYIEIIEENANGMKIDKSYNKIARDGYNLLIMGYRGKNAMSHKLAFIEAFNILESEVQRLRIEGRAPTQPRIEGPKYRCGHCREWLPFEMFSRDNARDPPRQSWCKICQSGRYGGGGRPNKNPPKAINPSVNFVPVSKTFSFSPHVSPPKRDQVPFEIVPARPVAPARDGSDMVSQLLHIVAQQSEIINRLLGK